MKIKSITFENYKAFKDKQTLELKPITILIGKNSSGKSAIAKLFPLIENSLSKRFEEPLLLINNDVELGGEFVDLVFGKQPLPVTFSVEFHDGVNISASILQEPGKYDLKIYEWSYRYHEKSLSLKFTPDIGYLDTMSNKIYDCIFKGIVPIKLTDENGTDILGEFKLDFNLDVDYVGPFRILPERQFFLSGQLKYDKIGVKGENAYPQLGVSKLMKMPLHKKVGEWYKKCFDDWELKVEDIRRSSIQILLSKNDTDINIVDVGQGMNQVLPLVVRAITSKPNSLIIMEQPELHLHPAAHGDLMELFAFSSKENQQTFIIETHSENMLLRIRKLIVSNNFNFSRNDVIIYWINDSDSGGKAIKAITIDDEGALSDWPEDVFNENVNEIIEMRKALKLKNKDRNDSRI